MKIYLTGASKELELCESFRDRLRAAGHVITHDWMREIRCCPVSDHDLSHESRVQYALDDMRGVMAADITWILIPENTSAGCWVEMGIALGVGGCVVVSGNWRKCIFADLAVYRFTTHESALEWITTEATAA